MPAGAAPHRESATCRRTAHPGHSPSVDRCPATHCLGPARHSRGGIISGRASTNGHPSRKAATSPRHRIGRSRQTSLPSPTAPVPGGDVVGRRSKGRVGQRDVGGGCACGSGGRAGSWGGSPWRVRSVQRDWSGRAREPRRGRVPCVPARLVHPAVRARAMQGPGGCFVHAPLHCMDATFRDGQKAARHCTRPILHLRPPIPSKPSLRWCNSCGECVVYYTLNYQ